MKTSKNNSRQTVPKKKEGFVTKRFRELEEKMYTKEDHAQFMVWMKKKFKEVKDAGQI